ncbi:MAG: hypothetical protein R2844_03860 [Caldilineales bacterium]
MRATTDIRKHVLEYDDVVNKRREVIYDQRRRVLSEPTLRPTVLGMVASQIAWWTRSRSSRRMARSWPVCKALTAMLPLPDHVTVESWQSMTTDEIRTSSRSTARLSTICAPRPTGPRLCASSTTRTDAGQPWPARRSVQRRGLPSCALATGRRNRREPSTLASARQFLKTSSKR